MIYLILYYNIGIVYLIYNHGYTFPDKHSFLILSLILINFYPLLLFLELILIIATLYENIKKDYLKSLNEVFNYLYEDEKNHFEEELKVDLPVYPSKILEWMIKNKKTNHILYHLLVLNEYDKDKDLDDDFSYIFKKNYYKFKINTLEKKFKCSYLGDFPFKIKDKNDYYNFPISVFYRKYPKANETRYLGIFMQEDKLLLTDASFILDYKIPVLKTRKKYLCSTYRHDYDSFHGKFIDGGLNYLKTNELKNIFYTKITNDEVRRV